MASRLVEAEASASTHNQELDILRMMVHSLQHENRDLRRQIKETKDKPPLPSRQGDASLDGGNFKLGQGDISTGGRRTEM